MTKIKYRTGAVRYQTGMKTLLRILSCVIMTVSLGLYSTQSLANMRYDGDVMSIVICSDAGVETISIDANGNPVPPRSNCYTCVSCSAPTTGLDTQMAPLPLWIASHHTLVFENRDQISPVVNNSLVQARGPPTTDMQNGARTLHGCGSVYKDTTA